MNLDGAAGDLLSDAGRMMHVQANRGTSLTMARFPRRQLVLVRCCLCNIRIANQTHRENEFEADVLFEASKTNELRHFCGCFRSVEFSGLAFHLDFINRYSLWNE